VDRLPRLKKQAHVWAGCVSAAVYISTASAAEKAAGLAAVQALVRELDEDATYAGSLVVSVLYGHEDSPWLWDCTTPGAADGALYPINALRNLAASVVQSALVFLVDVDFVPSAGLQQWVQRAAAEQNLLVRCDAGELVVVPAFERVVPTDHADADALGLSLEAVCAGLEHGSVTAFHVKHFPAGHSPTNYAKWRELSAQPSLQYEVPYGDYYEPYVIMARSRFVPYDERFRGYGMNKCVHLRALAERGCTFHVLPGHFLVADAHEKSVAHRRTYGSQSGYRKHVVAAAYRAALRDIRAGREPAVSKATARLLRQAGTGSHTGAWKAKAEALKKEMKKVVAHVTQAGKGGLLEAASGSVESIV
jgi:glycosyltransferase-like protein LARGE